LHHCIIATSHKVVNVDYHVQKVGFQITLFLALFLRFQQVQGHQLRNVTGGSTECFHDYKKEAFSRGKMLGTSKTVRVALPLRNPHLEP